MSIPWWGYVSLRWMVTIALILGLRVHNGCTGSPNLCVQA